MGLLFFFIIKNNIIILYYLYEYMDSNSSSISASSVSTASLVDKSLLEETPTIDQTYGTKETPGFCQTSTTMPSMNTMVRPSVE